MRQLVPRESVPRRTCGYRGAASNARAPVAGDRAGRTPSPHALRHQWRKESRRARVGSTEKRAAVAARHRVLARRVRGPVENEHWPTLLYDTGGGQTFGRAFVRRPRRTNAALHERRHANGSPNLVTISLACAKAVEINDPSAGSPTETLLRLLLPLNDQVRSSSRHTGAAVARRAGTNPRISLNRSIGSSDGRCVQRAGT